LRRFTKHPAVKVNLRNFRFWGTSTALFASFTFSFNR
jgi:hypothetical protein